MSTTRIIVILIMSLPVFQVFAASDIYVYPNNGQPQDQQSRDRYDCHIWAAHQSGFDPSVFSTTAAAPILVASASTHHYPPRHGIDPITGAAGGAALGALGGAIAGDAGKGAAIGAGVGALAGIFNAAGNHHREREKRAHILAQQAASQFEQQRQEQQVQAKYKRAISACLEAKNYTVR